MREGTYRFECDTAKGWDLRKQSFAFTLDNSRNDFEFRYLLNGTVQSVPAGERQHLTHAYPPQACYDDGQNHVKQTWLNHGGRMVTVTPQGTVELVKPELLAAQ